MDSDITNHRILPEIPMNGVRTPTMARPRIYAEDRVQTAVRIPRSLHDRLAEEANAREIAVNLLIVNAIAEHLDNLPPVPRPRTRSG